tara:strand:- start:30 stop:482 length:453 start_codon:yes stop_codon:yes gene_type:complete
MKFFIFLLFIFILNCSTNKVVKHHGVQFLEKKNKKLIVNTSNKNDVIRILGNPSTKSSFDNDVWIYIERKMTTGSILKLGARELSVNNVLVLEINDMGILKNKKLYKKDEMNDIEFDQTSTKGIYSKRSFVYDFLSSMRQKINDPLGKRK